MHVYLTLKQILLNQIAVLLRKKFDSPKADKHDIDRLNKRLGYLQQALEEIKSYDHNKNFKFVLRHFNIELTNNEVKLIASLSARFGNGINSPKKGNKSGFTTTRSETLFTGAETEQYDDFFGDESDPEDEEHKFDYRKTKSQQKSNHHQMVGIGASTWIHYKGFEYWLKKQSFIKLKNKKDAARFKKIWNTLIGLNLFNGWKNGNIGSQNIIGPYGTSRPYIAIHKCGSKEVVKASLLRISVTNNRIFRFDLSPNSRTSSKNRARRSLDMDNEPDINTNDFEDSQETANNLMKGRNLFNQVLNKDVLRICATMLWDKNLANNVLEELLHNPRFSMYGIHAKNIADVIAKEMNLASMKSVEDDHPNSSHNDHDNNSSKVEQFELPSPQRPVTSMENNQNKNESRNKNQSNNNNNNGQQPQLYDNTGNVQHSLSSNNNSVSKTNPNNKNLSDHERHYYEQKQIDEHNKKPAPIQEEHDDEPQDFESGQQTKSYDEYEPYDQSKYSDDDDESDGNIPSHHKQSSVVEHQIPMHHINASEIGDGNANYDSPVANDDTDVESSSSNEYDDKNRNSVKKTQPIKSKIGNQKKGRTQKNRKSFVKENFKSTKVAEHDKWSKIAGHIQRAFNNKVARALQQYSIKEEFDFQQILDDIEDYSEEENESVIIEYMKQIFKWDNKECNRFYRTIRRILMDRRASNRSETIGLDISQLMNMEVSNEASTKKEDRMYPQQFTKKWSQSLLNKLQQYIMEEEYDLEAVAEDLDSFGEENSMIIEEMKKLYKWDRKISKKFVSDLKKIIKTDPRSAEKYLKIVNEESDSDSDGHFSGKW